jgi:hypothetical protein
MTEQREEDAAIIDAHQELVSRIEQGTGRMKILSALTIIVGAFLSVSYVLQLLLPLAGTKTVSVDLTDPANIATELVVLGLAVVWLYVGLSDFRFSSRMRREIAKARSEENEIERRITVGS